MAQKRPRHAGKAGKITGSSRSHPPTKGQVPKKVPGGRSPKKKGY